MKHVNWGIVGLGNIAHYFVQDLLTVKNATLYAVASRSQYKANDFAKQYDAKKAYGSYAELYKDEDVDVIYIATPHALHLENTLSALQAKKAVLCEKPMALSYNEIKQIADKAKAHNVFLMEAIWTNFMPHLEKVFDITTQKTYGQLNYISAEFCFKANYNPEGRLFNPKLGGGTLLDIGIYPVYLCLKLLGVPDEIEASQINAKTGVDLETKIHFKYTNGATAELLCSFDKSTPSEAFLEYDNAKIKLHSRFHETDKMTITSTSKTEHLDYNHQHRGYNFEIEHAQDCLSKGLTESPKLPLNFSLDLIKILDEISKNAMTNPRA